MHTKNLSSAFFSASSPTSELARIKHGAHQTGVHLLGQFVPQRWAHAQHCQQSLAAISGHILRGTDGKGREWGSYAIM